MPMGVRLTQEEINEFLTKGHTVILATIRKSGEPLMTPLWYVYKDGAIYIRTLAKSPKVQHVKRDPRVCCLVEEGEAWIDLKAVIANCDAEVIEDEQTLKEVGEALGEKYKGFRPDTSKQPNATRKHYSSGSVVIKMTPRPGEVRSWYNRKIKMAS
jgi:PPOX class probable F420-dependent enzyme